MNDANPQGLDLQNIGKHFTMGGEELHVLNGASLTIAPGEIVAMLGPSGAGKSTLLHIAGLLDRPDTGEITIDGQACGSLGDTDRTRIRRTAIGFVYQFHNLLPEFTATDNVALACMINGVSQKDARKRARELLEILGLSERLEHMPTQLSGGEQQRVAIARAMANHPRILLADEPTGNLDENTADTVFDALITLAREEKVAALIATHNIGLAKRMDRRIVLHNGRLEGQPVSG
ncbi:MAG: ABC transporter ATP-binding protein [Alphaproteobacteria bacterium]|nr:MAG: ABC transporter ATP-binding protein [Alphaproteobacteria bacterium]